ncbi:MAG: flavodoxin family protein [Candidatus Hadarchaeales archaeon]
MKALAFNGSPRGEQGNTDLLLKPFLEGMREEGAEVELFYVNRLKIKPCNGRFTCWTKTPGRCVHEDDMTFLYPKLAEAEVWVFAFPIYVDGMPGPLKTMVDRLLPLLKPFFELREGHCRHPLREGVKGGKVVMVATCGFWEKDNFHPALEHVKAMCRNAGREFAGALLRPHGGGLRLLLKLGLPLDDLFEACREAGRRLVREGKIPEELQRKVERELMPLDQYVEAANATFQAALEEGVIPEL